MVTLGACEGEAPPPAAVAAVGESQLSGIVGDLIAAPLSVRVTDAKGKALGGVPVTFAVADGGGSVSKAVDTTTAAGTATTRWTLGERAGAQRVTASVAAVAGQVSFTATARAGAPASIVANGGNQQTVVVGTAVLTAPSVVVRDRFANPVPGVSVIFTVAGGGGAVTGGATTTNSSGVATVTEWRLGPSMGPNSLTALALGSGITGNPVTFTATATAGVPAQLSAVGGTSISGTVFRAMVPVPQVRVADASGNAVAGASVTFTGSTGTTVAGPSKTTDASGLAAPDGWVLGTAVGNYTLTAAVGGVPNLVITAAARADAATAMTIVAGNNQTAQAGRTVATEPSVRVTDQHSNPVAGIEVLFEVATGGGTAVGRRATTNSQGVATVGGWTLGDAVGSNTLVVSVVTSGVSVPPVTFTATATAGAAATMSATAGQNQTAPAGTAVPTAPAVVVRDARGNPVSGVAVIFSVGSGGGMVTGASTSSNALGIATVGSWVLGGGVGTQTLIARSGTLPEVTFAATATAGTAARIAAWSSQVQTGIVAGTALSVSQRPAVRVTDAEGNPVTGVAVTFRVAQDGTSGTLTGGDTVASAATNTNGIATVGAWTLPGTAGTTATVRASVSTLADTVTFTVSTTPGAVSRLVITSGGAATLSTSAGATASTITITARDANNNVVTTYGGGKTLVFSGAGTAPGGTVPTADGVSFGTATPITFVNGVATAAIRLFRAETAVIAVSDGGISSGSGSLVASVAAGAAVAFERVSPSATPSAIVGVLARSYTVKLVDAFGNGIVNASVTLTASHGTFSGSGTNAQTGTTASDGTVTVTWTNATAVTAATQTITVTSGGVTSIHTFSVS